MKSQDRPKGRPLVPNSQLENANKKHAKRRKIRLKKAISRIFSLILNVQNIQLYIDGW